MDGKTKLYLAIVALPICFGRAAWNVYVGRYYAALSLTIVFLGALLNLIVMSANQWRMPVVGIDANTPKMRRSRLHAVASAKTKHVFLADSIRLGRYHLSVGDLLMYLGCILVLFVT